MNSCTPGRSLTGAPIGRTATSTSGAASNETSTPDTPGGRLASLKPTRSLPLIAKSVTWIGILTAGTNAVGLTTAPMTMCEETVRQSRSNSNWRYSATGSKRET